MSFYVQHMKRLKKEETPGHFHITYAKQFSSRLIYP